MMQLNIIGREREINLLEQLMDSKAAEFVAVHGRRRVGKTYMLQQFVSTQDVYLECTGTKEGSLKDQLLIFNKSLAKTFYPNAQLEPPRNWYEALERLTAEIKRIPPTKKIAIFFDELPWLASPKSKLMQNIDHFWNTEWQKLPNLKFVVCGSAASWMLDNLINAKGGLYNRITRTIHLEPFNLAETKQFLESKKIKITQKQTLDIYMVMGGIPFYLQ